MDIWNRFGICTLFWSTIGQKGNEYSQTSLKNGLENKNIWNKLLNNTCSINDDMVTLTTYFEVINGEVVFLFRI